MLLFLYPGFLRGKDLQLSFYHFYKKYLKDANVLKTNNETKQFVVNLIISIR